MNISLKQLSLTKLRTRVRFLFIFFIYCFIVLFGDGMIGEVSCLWFDSDGLMALSDFKGPKPKYSPYSTVLFMQINAKKTKYVFFWGENREIISLICTNRITPAQLTNSTSASILDIPQLFEKITKGKTIQSNLKIILS